MDSFNRNWIMDRAARQARKLLAEDRGDEALAVLKEADRRCDRIEAREELFAELLRLHALFTPNKPRPATFAEYIRNLRSEVA